MKIYAKKLAVSLALPLLVGLTAALLIRGGVEAYGQMPQPALSPPPALFPAVWTVLYLLMGTASYLVWSRRNFSRPALGLYLVQLAFNFVWPLLFFRAGAYGFAFFWLLALVLLAVATTALFFRESRPAGLLMLPYCAWLTFAAYLNCAVWMLNR